MATRVANILSTLVPIDYRRRDYRLPYRHVIDFKNPFYFLIHQKLCWSFSVSFCELFRELIGIIVHQDCGTLESSPCEAADVMFNPHFPQPCPFVGYASTTYFCICHSATDSAKVRCKFLQKIVKLLKLYFIVTQFSFKFQWYLSLSCM